MTGCTRSRPRCDDCGRPICERCGRCKARRPTHPGSWTVYCPALACRLVKAAKQMNPLQGVTGRKPPSHR